MSGKDKMAEERRQAEKQENHHYGNSNDGPLNYWATQLLRCRSCDVMFESDVMFECDVAMRCDVEM